MSTNQRTLRREYPATNRSIPTVFGWATAALLPLKTVGRLLVGSSHGPRSYRREGFPEHEMQQVISGHIDRFRDL